MFKFCVASQINEVEVLRSMFCGDKEFTIIDEEKYITLKFDVDHKRALHHDTPLLSINVRVPWADSTKNVFINIKMPAFYPSAEALRAQVFGTSSLLNKTQEDALDDAISKFAESHIGRETALELVQFVASWLEENVTRAPVPVTQTGAKKAGGKRAVVRTTAKPAAHVVAQTSNKEFRRILVWFCTIAPDRAKTIFEWAKQLRLTGFCRLGSPAFLYLEGPKEDVDEYFSGLRSFRWKKMDLIWEEKAKAPKLADFQRFPGFQEVNVSLPGLQPIFKQAGMEGVYRESLKIRG